MTPATLAGSNAAAGHAVADTDAQGLVAIIGMACRFPGSDDVDGFWRMICAGTDVFRRFDPDELQDTFSDDDRSSDSYVPVRPSLKDIDRFDAGFFGMYPREAAMTDPQHRVFLEICWEALENAGIDPYSASESIGVFAGATMPTYLINNVLGNREKVEEFTNNYQVGCYEQFIGSMNEALAMRVAYKFNLRGPAYTMQSACSTSLLTVTQACDNLMNYNCDLALAGGVSITVPQERGYIAQEGGMVSVDGVCRPFDQAANGTVFGSGAGVVLLKRLEDALEDGDRIVAVIRGYGVNNDGNDKVGFTAPSVNGQADALAMALARAQIDPATVGYIECHGTATPVGDPIEFRGICEAYGRDDGIACALGSAKGNLGHLDAAGGICGLIKTALVVQNGVIPAVANFSSANPRMGIDQSRYYVPRTTSDWPGEDAPRRAGVSAFGVGGTNVHIILEEPPAQPVADADAIAACHILPLSARTEDALRQMHERLAAHLSANPDLNIASVARTLQTGRHAFTCRSAVVARTLDEAAEKLGGQRAQAANASDAPPVVFMFPGQGAQYVGMAATLYATEPEFARWIDRGAEQLKPLLKLDLRDFLCHTGPVSQAMSDEQRETAIAQPCLYIIEYALARLWMSRGLEPDAMIGHSVGEFVAATLANTLSFEEGLKLVAARGKVMQAQPEGAMVSVRCDAETAALHLVDGVEIAAVNAPKLCVLSGPFDAMDRTCAQLGEADIAFSRLHTSHAFHSAMMEAASAALREETARVTYGSASIPYISCVTGDWQTDQQGASPDYWARHCRDAVQFAKGLQTLCTDRVPVLLEVGPGRTLSVFAQQTIARDGFAAVIQSLPDHDRAAMANETLAEAHGKLWMSGCSLQWPELPEVARRCLPLPTYPFQRQRHWIEAPASMRNQRANNATGQPQTAGYTPPAAAVYPDTVADKESSTMNAVTQIAASNRVPRLETELLSLLSDMSGENIGENDKTATFMELGFDSLFIGQFAQKIEKTFKVKLSFRELLSNIPTITDLAVHLDKEMPPEPGEVTPATAPEPAAPTPESNGGMQPAIQLPVGTMPSAVSGPSSAAVAGDLAGILQQQLQVAQALFGAQLQVLQGLGQGPAQVHTATPPHGPVAPASVHAQPAPQYQPEDNAEYGNERIKLYRPAAGSSATAMTPQKREYIARLTKAYAAKSPKSKAFVQENRNHLADPRTAAGFRSEWKEMVFPVVSDRSKGSRIWDIDGNEYIDLVNGFGQTAFGHAPDFVVDAMKAQMEAGFAIGPQTPLAGEVAAMVSDMVGLERVTFCNTGSEAVMAAMRVARAVTGNERVVVFANDYHGQFDEVLVKGRNKAGNPVALPVASGIPNDSVANMTVLKYGAPESLDWIRANLGDLAAVIIEPVQSRHPELQPVEFVRDLRKLATDAGFALVFDEVVTGFRVAPGGMQALWGIKADMATYGKVVGGGMPIGILAGDARFMDALDGGTWSYGDDSVPMTAPTFFAGTFVRHPVILAACRAVLNHIKGEGMALYERVATRTEQLVAEINADLEARGIRGAVHGFKSWFAAHFSDLDPLGSLMFAELRLRGIHVQEGYPCVLTTAHSEEDFKAIAKAFRDSIDSLQSAGILPPDGAAVLQPSSSPSKSATAPSSSTRLTEAQKEIWLSAQAGDEASCSFNESFTLTLTGDFDEAAFRAALADVVARHDALRIHFARDGGRFEFIDGFTLDLPLMDLSGDANGETKLAEMLDSEARTPFDLVNGPLVRAMLVRMDGTTHKLVCTAHHIICDGWSINILIDELAALYKACLIGEAASLEKPVSFATYATELAPDAEADPAAENYWLGEFATIPDLPELPVDRQHPEYKTYRGGTRTGHIDADTCKRLKKAGGKAGATLFSTLLGALQVMLSRLSGAEDIVVAIPSAGQSLVEEGTLVGHCVNLLPLRQTVRRDTGFDAHLKNTQETVLKAFEHQNYTYGTLVRKRGVKRDPRRLPLTEIQFNLERIGNGADFGGLDASVVPNPKAFSNFDMFFNVIESADGLRIDVDYNGDVYDGSTVDRFIGHFAKLATAIADDITMPVAQLPLLDGTQTAWLADSLNDSAVDFGSTAPVHALFSALAAKQPEAVAATHGKESLTYGELEARANQLARHLQALLPDSGQRIALLVERSLDMLVALLGVMKAGHAYVPLDCAHPETRLRQTLETAQVAAIICADDAMAALAGKGTAVVRLDTDAKTIAARGKTAPKPFDTAEAPPAYIIFTSGSTGTPKGVQVSHAALANFLHAMAREPGFGPKDTIIAVTTISFDIAALELYLPLITGGKVVIADRAQVQDGFALVDLIVETGPTVLQATPTLWRMLVEAGLKGMPGLKMLAGGEPLPADLAGSLLTIGGELWNMYGPTETTIWSSLARIEDAARPITIGHPIANTQLYIVDTADRLASIGVTGELLIGGDGLADCYSDRPDLTSRAFVDLDIGTGKKQRLYRTGDVGKRLVDGSLQLLGRRDNQIKLRGFRIELGDIESVVAKAPGVRQCAVVVVRKENGDGQLVAYVVPRDASAQPEAAVLLEHARAQLPVHMVPGFWVTVNALPQTGNGKLDRKNLEQRALPRKIKAVTKSRPKTRMEEMLTGIWQDVLGEQEIGLEDNIYALGADSLIIFRIASRMLDAGLQLEAKDLMRHPSIAALAAFADKRNAEGLNGSDRLPSLRDFRAGARRATVAGAAE